MEGASKYQRVPQPTKLTAFHEPLHTALLADAHRAKHERRTALASYAEIRGKAAVAYQAFVPLSFELGEAFQFDWSEEGLVIGAAFTGACRYRT